MGSFIARQPNGLLCRWSSIVDNLTHYDMTEEDYIEYRAECARKEARLDLQNPLFCCLKVTETYCRTKWKKETRYCFFHYPIPQK